MLALYLATFGFGATMILVSLLLGGAGDKDLHADHDASGDAGGDAAADTDNDAGTADVDHDADAQADAQADADGDGQAEGQAPGAGHVDHAGGDGGWWLPLLSLRFWTFGSAAFGLAGTMLTVLAVPAALALVVAVLLGLGTGVGAARFFSALRNDSVSGETELGGYVGEEGKVVLPVRAGAVGKIGISTMSGRVEMMARTKDTGDLEVGTAVLVASVDKEGVAEVSRILPGPEREARKRAVQSAQAAIRTGER